MRLAEFILAHREPILKEWETFARTIWPGATADSLVLRDHAEDMLVAVAWDMKSSQPEHEQVAKSKGHGGEGSKGQSEANQKVDTASNMHALSRLSSGFELRELVAEYRALRASVVQLWTADTPATGPQEMQDIIRFNEAIDQLLSESIASYAQKVDASREYFLGILGHDLRTPLSSATLLAYLLAESTTLEPACRHMAITMRSSLDAMNDLVRDMLDFTGARLGVRMMVRPKAVDMVDLCNEVLAEMRAIHPTRKFNLEAGNGDVTGTWDRGRLRQLISNLLGNSIQHGSADTPVTLTISGEEGEVLLAVHNFGNPIPEDKLGVVFDPLKRHLHSGLSDHGTPAGSVGLGLYIAREVATAHRGSIWVVSSGNETIFTVRLPRHCPGGA